MPDMEKFGVEEEESDTKTAAQLKGFCPICGEELCPQEVTGILLCPRCGSKPFEGKAHAADGSPNIRK